METKHGVKITDYCLNKKHNVNNTSDNSHLITKNKTINCPGSC